VLAPLIALFPCQCNDPDAKATPHGFFAVSFFIVIAFVCIKCGPETLDLMREAGRQDDANRYARLYRGLGIFMAISPVAAAGLSLVIGQFEKLRLFAEVFGIYTFASYWLVKSRELETTQADRLAVTGRAVRSRRAVKRAERQVV
jgi:hypothetical protein